MTGASTPAAVPAIMWLRDTAAQDVELTGVKAAMLARLTRSGYSVPNGFVITVPALAGLGEGNDGSPPQLPEPLRAALREALAAGEEQAWAVRSSAVAEDTATASFAGQYETFLDVRGTPAIEEAVAACWASSRQPVSPEYLDRQAPCDRRIAVLVQRYVDAELAGVAFGADPVNGDRNTVVVSAVRGACAGLVSGRAMPDVWEVASGKARRRGLASGSHERPPAGRPPAASPEQVLTAAQARSVAALLRDLETGHGKPQDLEWAIAGGELTVLQLRPMTALPAVVDWRAPLPGGWLRSIRLGEWLPEPVTPLCDSWLLDRMEERLRCRQRADGGFQAPRPLHVLVHGWYFHSPLGSGGQVLLLAGLLRRPGLALAVLLGRRRPEWSEHLAYGRFARRWRTEILPAYRAAVATAAELVETAPPTDLVDLVDRVADAAGDCYWSLVIAGGAAWRAEQALARFHRRHLDKRSTQYQSLLAGLAAPSTPRHAVHSLDWVHPTVGELAPCTSPVGLDQIEPTAFDRDRHTRVVHERRTAEDACLRALSGPAQAPVRRRFGRLLAAARRSALRRADHTYWLTAGWPVMRRALRRLGEILCAADHLDEPDDVFFLDRTDIERWSGGDPGDLRALVQMHREEWERQRRLIPPAAVGRTPFLLSRVLPRTESPVRRSAENPVLNGVAASPGRATGPARILHAPTALSGIRRGDVLVVPAALPALTAVFERIAGLCVDNGSLAAHAAILAREYGIPAVMGLRDATDRLNDDQIITVDGATGVVEI